MFRKSKSSEIRKCGCCMKSIQEGDGLAQTEQLNLIFTKLIGFFLPSFSFICQSCHDNLMNFSAFQKEIRRKHGFKNAFEKVEAERKELATKLKEQEDEHKIESTSSAHDKKSDETSSPTLKAIKIARERMKLPSRKSKRSLKSAEVRQEDEPTPKREKRGGNLREEILGNLKMVLAVEQDEDSDPESPQLGEEEDPDDDEVIILPPEAPIDVDTLAELPAKPKDTSSLFKCEHCNAVSTKMEIIVEHTKTTHCHQCGNCDQIFPTVELVQDHNRRVHDRRRKQVYQPVMMEENLNFQLRAKPRGRPWGNRDGYYEG
jgi:hypothetical protein